MLTWPKQCFQNTTSRVVYKQDYKFSKKYKVFNLILTLIRFRIKFKGPNSVKT